MEDKKIKVRVRLIIIKNDKVLLHYSPKDKYYFYIGGKMEFGETVVQAAVREAKEETGGNFEFKKILYIRDFIHPEENEHSLELFILGDLDRFEEVLEWTDEDKESHHKISWVELSKLKDINIKPQALTDTLFKDAAANFTDGTKYIGEII